MELPYLLVCDRWCIKTGSFTGLPQFLHLRMCDSFVILLPCFQVVPGPNAFLDECKAIVSVSIEDGILSENQLRDLLASSGHLQSFYPSSGVRFSQAIRFYVPDQLITCWFSVILQSIPTLGVPRCLSVTPTSCASVGLVSALNSSPPRNSLRTRPQSVLL